MRCKDCPIPPMYDHSEHAKLCGLFGWDNDDEHFTTYANGDEGCIHRKKTLEKWWNERFKQGVII